MTGTTARDPNAGVPLQDLNMPMISAVSVTPDDVNEMQYVARAIYVGGAGNLSVVLKNDQAPVTFTGLTAGTLLPIRARQVKATGTTATLIVAMH